MLSIITSGVNAAVRRLVLSSAALRDLTATNKKVGVVVLRWIDKNFKSEGARTGQRWQQLSAGTIKRRRSGKNKSAVKAKILQDTGDLRRNWKVLATPNEVIVESQMPYARDHHYGVPSRKLPARPILPSNKQVMPGLLKIYKAKVRQVVK